MKHFCTISIFIITILSCSTSKGLWGRNKSFKDIQKNYKQGEEYEINKSFKKGAPLIIAIHGGRIEEGTSELLHAVAQDNFSYYEFKAKAAPDYNPQILQSGYLHLTSHRFDDPDLIQLANKSNYCLSLHGYPATKAKADFCVGGGNKKLRVKLVSSLTKSFPDLKTCELCCPPYRGLHKNNVVNLCKQKGIQIEMSPRLRRKLKDNSGKNQLRERLVTVLRDVLKTK